MSRSTAAPDLQHRGGDADRRRSLSRWLGEAPGRPHQAFLENAVFRARRSVPLLLPGSSPDGAAHRVLSLSRPLRRGHWRGWRGPCAQPPVRTLVAGSLLQSCQACSCHSSFQLQLAYCLVSKSLFCTNVAWSPCPALAVCLPDTPFFEDLLLSEFPLCRPRSSGDRHQGARVCSPRDGSSPPGAVSWLPRPPR